MFWFTAIEPLHRKLGPAFISTNTLFVCPYIEPYIPDAERAGDLSGHVLNFFYVIGVFPFLLSDPPVVQQLKRTFKYFKDYRQVSGNRQTSCKHIMVNKISDCSHLWGRLQLCFLLEIWELTCSLHIYWVFKDWYHFSLGKLLNMSILGQRIEEIQE